MAISCPTTIVEVIWAVLVAVIIGVFAELRWAFHKMISKQEEIIKLHMDCQKELPDKYVTQRYMENWEKGRAPLWDAINRHSHKGIEGTGEVIKK